MRAYCRIALSGFIGAVGYFLVFKGWKIFSSIFYWGWKLVSSFAIFGRAFGLCELHMCL